MQSAATNSDSSTSPLDQSESAVPSQQKLDFDDNSVAAPSKVEKPQAKRQVVDSHRISVLMASYNKHFAVYSNGKKNITQILPAKVWKSVQFARI